MIEYFEGNIFLIRSVLDRNYIF